MQKMQFGIWLPTYGGLDRRKEWEPGYNQLNTFEKTGHERQKLEDQIIREIAELDY